MTFLPFRTASLAFHFNPHPLTEDDRWKSNTEKSCHEISIHILAQRMTISALEMDTGLSNFNPHPRTEDGNEDLNTKIEAL